MAMPASFAAALKLPCQSAPDRGKNAIGRRPDLGEDLQGRHSETRVMKKQLSGSVNRHGRDIKP